jgi:molecular chaperone GrpE
MKDREKQDDRPDEQDESSSASPGAQDQEGSAALEVPESTMIENLRKERDDLFSRLQRLSADYVNYQRRTQREVQEERSRGVVDLAKAIIAVLDDLELAIDHGRANHPADDPLLRGTEMVHGNALAKLKEFGVQPVPSEGQPFDPRNHEALAHQPTDQAEPMTVIKEVQKGYTFHGKTIRPAKVIVAAPAPAAAGKDEKGPACHPMDEPAE